MAVDDSTYAALLERLGVGPVSRPLLEEALTHASFLNEAEPGVRSNERLEFLGDAVLGLVIGRDLYRWYPDAGEGDLTRMRAEIVRGSTLARTAARLDLGSHLVLGKGEEAAGGRTRERNLAGAFEAVVGAIFQSRGMRVTTKFILQLFADELAQLRREGAQIDPKSRLQHLVQARWRQPPEYVTVEEESGGPGLRFTVEVKAVGVPLGRGSGGNKREAQQAAAEDALHAIAARAPGD